MADFSIIRPYQAPAPIYSTYQAPQRQQSESDGNPFFDQLNQGLKLAGSISGAVGKYKQSQAETAQLERQQAFNQAFGKAYQSGDKGSITKLIGQFPEQFAQIKQAAGFKDEEQNKAFGSLGLQLKGAIDSGNPQAAAQLIASHQDVLRQAGPGYEPEALLSTLQSDPAGLAKRADVFALTSLGPETYYKVTGQRATDETNRRGQDITARGQDVTMRGQDIQQAEGAANRAISNANLGLRQQEIQIKALEAQNKNIDRGLARETNELKRQELQQKLEMNVAKTEQAKADRASAAEGVANTFAQAKGSADRLLSHPGLEKAVGIRSLAPTIPGTDSADFEAQLDTFKAQTFLPQVQSLKGMGALSDAEGKKLAESVGALSLKMRPETFRKELQRVQSTLDAAQKKALKGIPPPAPASQAGGGGGGGVKFLGFE